MEESEQRRERLKAMRIEAAQSGASNNLEGLGFASHGLSNPLSEKETTSATSVQFTSPRFDFYTDPMSAFSANIRKNVQSPRVSPMLYNTSPRRSYLERTPPPTYQHPSVNLPGQMMFQAPGVHYNHSPVRSPMETANPWGMTQGTPPRAWGGSSGGFNYNNPPNLPRGGGNFMGPGYGQGGSPYFDYGRGRGHRYNSSSNYGLGSGRWPYSNSGRGRDRSGNFMSPGSGKSGGRGVGSRSRDHVSAEVRPDLYYKKEMIEDPWRLLNPVPWKRLDGQDSGKSWLPTSIRGKNAKGSSGEASHISVSQPSLAEFLADSLKDPSSDAVDSEPGT